MAQLIFVLALFLATFGVKMSWRFISKTFVFEAQVEEFKMRIQSSTTVLQLTELYKDILFIYLKGTEYKYQKEKINNLMKDINSQIMVLKE